MRIVYEQVAGLDVHKKTVVAALIVKDAQGQWGMHKRTFGTMTTDLLSLSDWLMSLGVTHVAMESTGEFWKPVFNILENNFEVFVVNAQHISRVPGRKTDQSDAEWIAELMQYGLLQASFIPPSGQRELRDLTRHRANFVRERVNLVNRVQKVLETANIKLSSVATDIMGVSGRAMLAALIEGQTSPEAMAELAKGRMRDKREQLAQALDGRVKAHHRFILTELLCEIDHLEEVLARFDAEIEEYCHPFEWAVELLDTIPGVGREAAEVIVSEIGTDMNRFPTAAHLSAWAGVAPGNNESGGKFRSGRKRKGNRSLGVILNQAAQAAVHTKDCSLAAQYHRLAGRRGKNRAIVAVSHSILIIAYHLIRTRVPYQEKGANYFEKRKPQASLNYHKKGIERLGFRVVIEPINSVPA